MELTNGIVSSVSFHNEDNGFSVVNIRFGNDSAPVTCVGIMPLISTGEVVTVKGHWETHQRFGKQFVVEGYTRKRPTTTEGIIALLSSGIIENIGPVRARQIVNRFGLETLDILDTNSGRLTELPGFGKKTVKKISDQWNKDEDLQKLILFLSEYTISLGMIIKIHRAYGSEAQEKINKNPYVLSEDIWGIGFLTADSIAQKMGFSHDSYQRIQAGLLFIMNEAAEEGHSCLPVSELQKKATGLLEVSEEQVLFSLDHVFTVRMLIREKEWVYLPYLLYDEKLVAQNIRGRLVLGKQPDSTKNELCQWLDEYEKKLNWHADPMQRQAVIEAASQPCMLLTGGPGTGKTAILKVLVTFFREQQKNLLLAAPTGRAAQRLKDVTGATAQTIHRMLEYKPDNKKGGYSFNRNERNPLEADAVIIDEVSMIDVHLMSRLCAAVKKGARIIFVGDNNQLPSVGAGNVLSDLIDSRMIPHIQLTTVFRQAHSSRIITAAHEINNGITPVFDNSKDDNCFFLEEPDPQGVLEVIIDLVSRRLPASYHLNPIHDIQVLSPMHKGLLGTENLNNRLQETLRSSLKMVQNGQNCFYLGDKVMQIKNNYDKNVFNGDIGIVAEIVEETGVIVDYQGNFVTYEIALLDELLPAYCISIHKSQGSEFDAVIIPLMTQHYIMLQRNLIYTALTRAKKICVFVGTRRALNLAVHSNTTLVRYSCLSERIRTGS